MIDSKGRDEREKKILSLRGMGTKIQANLYLREYHPVIDLDASTSNAMRSSYKENGILENGKNPDLLSSHDLEKVRQKILEHESIFRNQIRELHRLYGRQRELMNEIKRRGINREDVMEEKFQLSYLFTPFPIENAKKSLNSCHSSSQHLVSSCEPRILNNSIVPSGNYNLGFPAEPYFSNTKKQMQERFSKFPIVESTSEKRNHQTACDRDNKFSLSAVQTSQHGGDTLTFDLYSRKNYPGEISSANPTDLSRAQISATSCSNLNLVTKDFFHDSLDRMNKEDPLSTLGLRNERSGKEHLSSGDYAVKRRIDKHSSGKSMAFPQSLLGEPRKDFSNFPLDIGTSLSRKKKKIFGVEISEGNDDAYDSASNMLSSLDRTEEKHRVPSLEATSLTADSFMQNLKLHGANWNDCKSERSKADLKGDQISSQKRLSCHSGSMNVKWLDLEGDPKNYFKNVDYTNVAAEVSKKDPEHSKKLPDCQSNQENHKGSLPWFLRNSQVSADSNNGTKSSYFMNLDSLQNCSQRFFGGTLQTSKQRREIEGEINEDDDVLQSFKDSGENPSKVNRFSIGDDCDGKVESDENAPRNHVATKELVLDNYVSDLRHCIDLNLSLDEADAPSAPSLPSAIVKIATTEIDLEAPAVIDSEMDASPDQELNSRKSDMLPCYQECDKIAAEAMIAISLSGEKELVDDNSLKWFAEVISSQRGDNAGVAVDVSMNESRAYEEEEEEEVIPDGMDHFEFMTLQLEDSKEEHHHYEAFVLKAPSDDEGGAALTRRTRRGHQSRRGRQRRDFQRDILPGLVTLSRLQVTEDFQAFEELLKAGGWQSHRSSTRNGRGRKRWGGAEEMKTPCSTQAQQPVCHIEERSLAGWGKKTRRLPRQRCPNAFLAFPVKC
ncbi:hypothetical protein C2S53_007543 [Perilla frutescens var. hirtella]|uniref:Uncharacterized protein n=1 Tax=Perilla frutescens var. hirtella TaxID=608512 RepID=A0AAD4JAY8_PERFH|nr:hypothetical protein C2S53_007543 [Perilla frutescens var. hirtella]